MIGDIARVGGLFVALAIGCGRVAFDPPADSPPATHDGPAIGKPPVAPGLLARYPMDDDPSDGTLDEATGSAPAAHCAGAACPMMAAGRYGNAVRFTGAQVATIANGSPAPSASAFSIAVWVFADDVASEHVAVAQPVGSDENDTFALVTEPGLTCFETATGAGAPPFDYEPACITSAMPAGRWVHLAGVWDGANKTLFLDGNAAARYTSAAVVVRDSHPLLIGADENFTVVDLFWRGLVDELQIYGRALSDDEVRALAR